MTRALVATSATSGLSLFFHALRFLSSQSPTASPDTSSPSFLETPLDQISPAERSVFEVAILFWDSLAIDFCGDPYWQWTAFGACL